jgi:inner membrane protein
LAPKNIRRPAAIGGGVSACLPDLDVLIRSSADPLLVLEYHRHFTHSLFFSPLGAALATLFLWPLLRHHLSVKALFLVALAGYLSACLLDVCTSYGTHLLWPLVAQPIALNWIAVVDPAFTLLIVIGLVLALRCQNPLKRFGLVAAALYLGVGALQQQRAETLAQQWAEDRFTPEAILAKPTMGNLVLWRVLLTEGDRVQVIAVRAGIFATRIYVGEVAEIQNPTRWNLPENSRAFRDAQRFARFSDGYQTAVKDRDDEIGDLRYAMLPTSTVPLWGIRIDRHDPAGKTEFFTRRDNSPAVRDAFLRMLRGQPLPAEPLP